MSGRRFAATLTMIAMLAAAGCTRMGPENLKGARINYNEAVAHSWDEQLLLNLVRLKYRDTPLFLEVTSVSTQYDMVYSAGASPGFGTTDSVTKGFTLGGALTSGIASAIDFTANTLTGSPSASTTHNAGLSRSKSRSSSRSVDFDTGFSYEETPTILYSPLQGQKFVEQMLTPIPPEAIMLLSKSGWSIERVIRLCLEEMNGLDNAPTASGPTPAIAPEYEGFAEVARLLRALQVHGELDMNIEEQDGVEALLLELDVRSETTEESRRIREMLKLAADESVYPLCLRRRPDADRAIVVQPRSLLGVMYFLSEGVEAPPRHVAEGRITQTMTPDGRPFDWTAVTGDLLRVQCSKARPDNAFTRVRYRGAWFYIHDADLNSKSTFGLLSYLFYLQAGDIRAVTPVLTLPVGK